MSPTTIICDGEKEFVQKSAIFSADTIRATLHSRDTCTIGLSGGSTPRATYEALGKEKMIDWSRVHVFLVDERHVSVDAPDSNEKLVRDTLLKYAAIPEENLLFPDASLSIEECVKTYDDALGTLLKNNSADLVVLGLGEDGHIASLFPHDETAIRESEKYSMHTTTDRFAIHDRITVTLPVLERATSKLFLLKGTAKKKVFDDMMASDENELRWPGKRLAGSATVIVMND